MSRDQNPFLTQGFDVVFRTRRCAGTVSAPPTSLFYVSSISISDIVPTDSTVLSGLAGVTSTKRTVRDAAVALFNTPNGPPTNQDALDALAGRIAQDWYDWTTADQPGDIRFGGVIAPDPNGLIDTISWMYASDDVSTRVQSPPHDSEPEEFQHLDPDTADCTDKHNADVPVDQIPAIDFYLGGADTCTGGGAKISAATYDGSMGIATVSVDTGGTYTSTPIIAVDQNTSGSGFTAIAVVSSGTLASVTVNTPGSGYPDPVVLSVGGGGGRLQRVRMRLALEDGRLVGRFVAYETVG